MCIITSKLNAGMDMQAHLCRFVVGKLSSLFILMNKITSTYNIVVGTKSTI